MIEQKQSEAVIKKPASDEAMLFLKTVCTICLGYEICPHTNRLCPRKSKVKQN